MPAMSVSENSTRRTALNSNAMSEASLLPLGLRLKNAGQKEKGSAPVSGAYEAAPPESARLEREALRRGRLRGLTDRRRRLQFLAAGREACDCHQRQQQQ